MSNRQTAISVSLTSSLLILGYYLIQIMRLLQREAFQPEDVFRLWATIIIASVILNVAGNVLTMIVLHIIHAIRTNSSEELRLLDDERDRMIALKGVRVAYFAGSIGTLLAMLAFVLGQPGLVMFSLLIFSGLVAEIIGDLSQFYFYRRGV